MKTEKLSKQKTDAFSYMEHCCELLHGNQREGTARIYRSACSRFMGFTGTDKLLFSRLTPKLMREYEDYLGKMRLRPNTVSTYLNCLRSMYNNAVGEGLADGNVMPFRSLRIRPVRTGKQSIRFEDIEKMIRFRISDSKLMFALDLFLFCVLACGIPFIDLAYLTWDNIQGDTLVYYRNKTNVRISVGLTRGMLAIINKYRGQGVGNFLFPILKSEDASYTEYRSALKSYNRRLEKISLLLHLPVKLTSYSARHTWAMEAKRQNTPMAVIGEALGHTSEKTTRYYLNSLDQSVLNKTNMRIVKDLDHLVITQNKECPLFMK